MLANLGRFLYGFHLHSDAVGFPSALAPSILMARLLAAFLALASGKLQVAVDEHCGYAPSHALILYTFLSFI